MRRTRLANTIVAGAAVILLTGLGTTPSFAARITFTIAPGGPFGATAVGAVVLKDTTTHNTFTCAASRAAGIFKHGTSLAGRHIGTIKTLSYSGCTATHFGAAAVHPAFLPWQINLSTYSSGTSTGKLTGLHFAIAAGACTLVLDWTTATTHDGKVPLTYINPPAHKLVFPGTAGSLKIYSAVGCGTYFASTDPVTLADTYTVGPAMTIT